MKKLLILVVILIFTASLSAQSKWSGFLFPVKENPRILKLNKNLKLADSTYNTHLVRFGASVAGVQILYNKVTKEVKFDPFEKIGIGLSYSFYKVTKGIPFNYLSLNGFVFIPVTEHDQTLSLAVTAAAFQLFGTNLSPQLGINFEPGNIKSDYFPIGPLVSLKYNF